MQARIHSITPYSVVNGPGNRSVVHFQGCTLNCPGCFNKDTHDLSIGRSMTVEEIIIEIPSDVDGVTISGGEPFLQQQFLLELVKNLKDRNHTIVIFSGFYLHEIKKMKTGIQVLDYIDALIDGRFEENQLADDGLHGSDNQNIHLFTDLYKEIDFDHRDTEIWLDENGNIQITGFPSIDFLNKIK